MNNQYFKINTLRYEFLVVLYPQKGGV